MWTSESEAIAIEMWLGGQSARKISEKLEGITRNAVIGKMHRLGHSKRPSAQSSERTRQESQIRERRRAKPKKAFIFGKPRLTGKPLPSVPYTRIDVPESQWVDFFDLREDQCHAIMADDQRRCGQMVHYKKLCADHHSLYRRHG